MSRRVLALLAVVLAAGVTACGTSGSPNSNAGSSSATASSSVASTASTAVCRAADGLRASLTDLRQVDVAQQGVATLQQAFTQVKGDVAALADAAGTQYGQEIQQVKSDSAAVQAAVDQAKANPSGQSISAVATATRTLVQDAQALLATVSASC